MSTFQAPLPRVALFDTNYVYQWSDGSNFNGFMLLELLMPSDGITPWAEVDYGNLFPGIRLPIMQKIPIVDGQANGGCGVFLNPDLVPPGSKYTVWFYDSTNRQLAGPSASFNVTTTGAFKPPVIPVLTVPSTTAPVVNPDTH